MPELGEVAHIVSVLRKFLVGKTITTVQAVEDPLLFAKPLTNVEFKTALEGQQVTEVNRHGKYFWLGFKESPKVALMHFGMTGWIKVKNIETHFIVMENGGDKKMSELFKDPEFKKKHAEMDFVENPDMEWPPRFHKFIITADDKTELAFTDPRRLGRVRLLDKENLLSQEPLCRLGKDFSNPEDRWDFETFRTQVTRRKVCIKTLLMDQSVFSGIGNWVADEIVYQARIHPEQMTNEMTDEQLEILYTKVIELCEFVVKVEGNTAALPDDFLMLYRWGKGRKEEIKTADGYVVKHLTVGGRTSSYVPELQKKVGSGGTAKRKNATTGKRSKKVKKEESEEDEEDSDTAEIKPKVEDQKVTTRSGRTSRRPQN